MIVFLTAFASCAYYYQHEEKNFLSWMRSTNQFFTGDEYKLRFGIFLTNARLVKEFNSQNKKFTVSLNQFAAYTQSEYKSLLGLRMTLLHSKAAKPTKTHSDSFDWRSKGIIFLVKDQGQCGSCWAFSAISAIEAHYAIYHGELTEFSEQQLVDCTSSCSGCNGGLMTDAFDFVIDDLGGMLCPASEYEYTGVDGACESCNDPVGPVMTGYYNVPQGDEENLADTVENMGPVAVAIDASNWSFQLYSGGIYDEPSCSSDSLDHGVSVVGFGEESGTKYWIVRNSWGASWGERGYIRMIWLNNQCGIASMASVPTG